MAPKGGEEVGVALGAGVEVFTKSEKGGGFPPVYMYTIGQRKGREGDGAHDGGCGHIIQSITLYNRKTRKKSYMILILLLIELAVMFYE